MIQIKQGNLFEEKTQALVNAVNCFGVMGKGIALQFKKNYPDNFKAYKQVCDNNQLQPGQIFIYDQGLSKNPRYIINFPTKKHWRNKSKLVDIEVGLKTLVLKIQQHQIKSIAIPPLGCGNGGLNWNIVKLLMIETLKSLPEVEIIIFEPFLAKG